ncbi:P2-related tail formation protein [Tepidimonas ignava]|uniref:P2-related tail formation protein n=1 Tax=Tepidimonas ignava TaxID=114249 RepID=A0A4R3LI10_9BURK|nr:phage tail protein [Tepidimonas ignava]TCS99118.1 P2-related tail formation protein [Tepidimonas ignava]TSE22798.1 Phage tail protein [Tepidimonas ignava]
MSDHLLPPNASPLERALSLSTDTLTRLAEPTEALRTFKVNPADPLLPWLIWEYGLGELLPYLPEPRRAIAEGIRWQRIRGTPAALAIALSWVGLSVQVEQETPGLHFAEFMVDSGRVLADDETIANLVAISRLSAPARSRLSRIYHGWDLRRLVLGDSRLGDALLSDHSGVFWRDGQTKLSFGRVHPLAQDWPAATLAAVYAPARFAAARLIDRYLLDYARLGDPGHTPNEEILHSHLFTVVNARGVRVAQTLLPERKFCRAMVVPSDSTPLGDTNACLPRFWVREEGGPIVLGNNALSDTPHRLIRVPILERFDAVHGDAALGSAPSWSASRDATRTRTAETRDGMLGWLRLGEARRAFDVLALARTVTLANAPLPDPAPWRARVFQRALIVLSDSTPLGDAQARTPRRGLWRVRDLPRLGAMTLGDGPEVVWRPIDAVVPRSHAVTAASSLLVASAPSLRRRHSRRAIAPSVAGAASREALARAAAAWRGQTWTDAPWPAGSWLDVRELIQTHHFTS